MEKPSGYYISDEVYRIRLLHELIIFDWYDHPDTFSLVNAYSISLYRQYAIGFPASAIELQNWHPQCIGQPKEEVFAMELSQVDVQLAVARMFGYIDWTDVIERMTDMDIEYERTIDLMLSGDVNGFRRKVKIRPELATMHSPLGHRAGLIHYLTANGLETTRQITPYAAPEMLQILLDAGADPEMSSNIYGGSQAIDLIQSSAHPQAAGVVEAMIRILNPS